MENQTEEGNKGSTARYTSMSNAPGCKNVPYHVQLYLWQSAKIDGGR